MDPIFGKINQRLGVKGQTPMALFLKIHLRPGSFITFTYEVIYLIDISVHMSILKSNSEVVDLLPAFKHAVLVK